MTRISHSNRPSGETEPDQLCRPRLLLMLFVTTILLMANGARAEWAHDALQRRLSRADAVLVHSWYSEVVTIGTVTRFRVLKLVAIRTETSSGSRRLGLLAHRNRGYLLRYSFPRKD